MVSNALLSSIVMNRHVFEVHIRIAGNSMGYGVAMNHTVFQSAIGGNNLIKRSRTLRDVTNLLTFDFG